MNKIFLPNRKFPSSKKIARKLLYQNYLIHSSYNINTLLINSIFLGNGTHFSARYMELINTISSKEYLFKFFNLLESRKKLYNLAKYYAETLRLFPNYFPLIEAKYILYNIINKQNLVDEQEMIQLKKQKKQKIIPLLKEKESSEMYSHIFNSKVNKEIYDNNDSTLEHLFGIKNNKSNLIMDLSSFKDKIKEVKPNVLYSCRSIQRDSDISNKNVNIIINTIENYENKNKINKTKKIIIKNNNKLKINNSLTNMKKINLKKNILNINNNSKKSFKNTNTSEIFKSSLIKSNSFNNNNKSKSKDNNFNININLTQNYKNKNTILTGCKKSVKIKASLPSNNNSNNRINLNLGSSNTFFHNTKNINSYQIYFQTSTSIYDNKNKNKNLSSKKKLYNNNVKNTFNKSRLSESSNTIEITKIFLNNRYKKKLSIFNNSRSIEKPKSKVKEINLGNNNKIKSRNYLYNICNSYKKKLTGSFYNSTMDKRNKLIKNINALNIKQKSVFK